jgi:thiamine pyrophosphokinase
MSNRPKMIILCNGKFPEHRVPLKILDEASEVVCCDGAAVKLLNYGKEPFAIVGDLDSLPTDLRSRFAERVFHYPDQESNDLTKAVKWCCDRGILELVILGGAGLREDHTIGNISLLAEYVDYMKVTMITDTGIFVPLRESATLESRPGQQVSIFAITPDTRISSEGLKYCITDRCFTNWNQGTLNESISNSFRINFDKGKLIIFREH